MGYHRRTEYNKLIIKIGEPLNVEGGWVRYGQVIGPTILLKGSVPGPRKRLIILREAIRPPRKQEKVEGIEYISLSPKN